MKAELVAALLETLREEFDQRTRASREARAGGNDPESRAESKYDTLSIEENYLADGLARQAAASLHAASEIEKMPVRDFAPQDPADVGALVNVAFADGDEWFLLAPAAGGQEVKHSGDTITVVTPESPLGVALLGKRAGEKLPGIKATLRAVK